MELQRLIDKAHILVEALPSIRRLIGTTIVIKYGGAAMAAADLRDAVMQDVALMKIVGMHPVVVHGGGPEISQAMKRMGKQASFVDGLRVTDEETMEIVQMALVGKINREVVALLGRHGGKAVGLSGHDAGLVRATRRLHRDIKTGESVDLGFVGDVQAVDTGIIEALDQAGYIPVIAPVGMGDDGHSYNINADTVAGAIAAALGAEKLVLLTDVEGVRANPADPGSVVSHIAAGEIRAALAKGRLTGGMIPKVECCLHALEGGVKRAHITDGRVPHVLLLELFSEKPVGTIVLQGEVIP